MEVKGKAFQLDQLLWVQRNSGVGAGIRQGT
jgi:hypothetical protein